MWRARSSATNCCNSFQYGLSNSARSTGFQSVFTNHPFQQIRSVLAVAVCRAVAAFIGERYRARFAAMFVVALLQAWDHHAIVQLHRDLRRVVAGFEGDFDLLT